MIWDRAVGAGRALTRDYGPVGSGSGIAFTATSLLRFVCGGLGDEALVQGVLAGREEGAGKGNDNTFWGINGYLPWLNRRKSKEADME